MPWGYFTYPLPDGDCDNIVNARVSRQTCARARSVCEPVAGVP